MANVSVKIDMASVRRKLLDAAGTSQSIRLQVKNRAYGVFKNAKRAMLREFDRHPITAEIEAGPRAVNISGTLDGYGNLFSFIGFELGDKPVEKLREFLRESTTMGEGSYRNGIWYFRITLPSKEAINEASPMPWEQGSGWAFAVEQGISGLSHYMFKRWSGGRSGYGFQLPYENMEESEFVPQPYMTEILAAFRERVNKAVEREED